MKKEIKKVLVTSMIGNALEWYDFVLFVQFTPFIGKLFFPAHNHDASLLAVFGVFAAGFIMRPIGGVLFGYFGDKFGRKISIIMSILLMSIPTAIIGILPTYESIGIMAPILLTVIRLFQGLALGGGFSGCMTLLVEHAPKTSRGLIGSTSMFSLGGGVLLGILVTGIFSNLMDQQDFENWGWRLPFIVSIFIGMVAFYIKNHVHESPIYLKAKKEDKLSKTPVRDVIFDHPKPLLTAVGIYLNVTVPFYTFSAFFNTFMQEKLKFTLQQAMTINGIAMFVLMVSILISGYLSDKYGRKTVLVFSAILMAALVYPLFKVIVQGEWIYALTGQVIFAIILGIYMGPTPAVLVELFTTNIRFSGLALSYNISAAIFGGTVPYISIKLIEYTNNLTSPSYYILFFSFISIIALINYKDKSRLPLE